MVQLILSRIQKYDMYARAYRLDDQHKIAMLCQAQKGPAMSYFMAITNNANLTWQEICIGLQKQFTTKNDNGLKMVFERKQMTGESVNEYWFDKLRIIKLKCPYLKSEDI